MDASFKKQGFKVVKGFYDINQHTERNPDLYQCLLDSRHLAIMDTQVRNAEAFYNHVELSKMHIKSLNRMEQETGLRLYPTYVYGRIYNPTSYLDKHRDRPACEISVTVNIGYDGDYSWPICIQDFDGNDHSVTLEAGDGLIYHGCELTHWRDPADSRVNNHAQTFLHYIRQDGQFENYIFDNPFADQQHQEKPKKEAGFMSKIKKFGRLK